MARDSYRKLGEGAVSDAVEASIAVMRLSAADGATINIGHDREEVVIRELAERVTALAKLSPRIVPEPAANAPIKRRCPDLSRARKLLEFEPQVDLDEGLRLTLAWCAERQSLVACP
jgi:UDP-glucuronate decarboxylase